MKAKRKPFRNSSQGWTNNYQISQSLSDDCHSNLISIAKAVHAANEQYLSVVADYLKWRRRSVSQAPFSTSQNLRRFSDSDLQSLKVVVQTQPPTDRSDIPGLVDSLRDVSYIGIWEQAAENMAYLKRHPKHRAQKHQDNARRRAVELKDCRIAAETGFGLVEKELRALGFDNACEAILEKIDMLRKYEEAYPLPLKSFLGFQSKPQLPFLIFFIFLVRCSHSFSCSLLGLNRLVPLDRLRILTFGW